MAWQDLADSSAFTYGFPILNALLAASSPGGARASYALQHGMNLANVYGQQAREDESRRKLGEIFSGEKFVTPQLNPDTQFSMPEQQPEPAFMMASAPLDEAGVGEGQAAPTPDMSMSRMAAPPVSPNVAAPTNKQPIFSPEERKLGEALASSRSGQDEAFRLAAQRLMPNRSRQPVSVAPGHSIYDFEQNRSVYTAPQAPDKERFQNVSRDEGGTITSGSFNRNTGEYMWDQPT